MSLSAEAVRLHILYLQNHSLHSPWFQLFSVLYGGLIAATAVGNALVVAAVVRRRKMWHARNVLILNLAISGISESEAM